MQVLWRGILWSVSFLANEASVSQKCDFQISAIVKRRFAPEQGVNLDTYNLAGGNWCIALLASHYVTNFIQISTIALEVLVKMAEPVVMELVNIPVNVFVDSLDRVAR